MTTRLLQSFNVLDNHSKKVLDRRARKNHQLSHLSRNCCSSCHEPDASLTFDYDWDSDFPGTKRTQQCLLHTRKLRVPQPAAIRGSSSSKSDEALGSTVSIRPFTSPEDLAWRTVPTPGKEEDSEGFMIIMLNKPQSPRPAKYPPHRLKWAREVERVPPFDVFNKDGSKAQVGGALSYTDTSHWCSSSSNNGRDTLSAFTEEEDGPFKLPGSVGKVVAEQLQRGNVVRVTTTAAHRREEACGEKSPPPDKDGQSESVPLSLDDELERKTVKVLTLRPPSVCTPLPMVSETYPVLFGRARRQSELFSSAGFHILTPPEAPRVRRRSHVHSAIIRITAATQEERALRELCERRRGEGGASGFGTFEACRELAAKRAGRDGGSHDVSLRALSADGSVIKAMELGRLPLCGGGRDAAPSATAPPTPTGRGPPLVPMVTAKRVSSARMGPVLNGVNPRQAGAGGSTPDYFKPLRCTERRKLPCHAPPPLSPPHNQDNHQDNQCNGMAFLFISKPLQHHLDHANAFVARQRPRKEDWRAEHAQLCHDFPTSQVADMEKIGVCGVKFSLLRPNSRADSKSQGAAGGKEAMMLPHSIYLTDNADSCLDSAGSGVGTGTVKLDSPFDRQQAISIPTAESV